MADLRRRPIAGHQDCEARRHLWPRRYHLGEILGVRRLLGRVKGLAVQIRQTGGYGILWPYNRPAYIFVPLLLREQGAYSIELKIILNKKGDFGRRCH